MQASVFLTIVEPTTPSFVAADSQLCSRRILEIKEKLKQGSSPRIESKGIATPPTHHRQILLRFVNTAFPAEHTRSTVFCVLCAQEGWVPFFNRQFNVNEIQTHLFPDSQLLMVPGSVSTTLVAKGTCPRKQKRKGQKIFVFIVCYCYVSERRRTLAASTSQY